MATGHFTGDPILIGLTTALVEDVYRAEQHDPVLSQQLAVKWEAVVPPTGPRGERASTIDRHVWRAFPHRKHEYPLSMLAPLSKLATIVDIKSSLDDHAARSALSPAPQTQPPRTGRFLPQTMSSTLE